MIESFDTDINFWEVHPEFKIAGEGKKLYSGDKSKGKSKSSLTMWYVKLTQDRKSKYYADDEKYILLSEDLMEDPKFHITHKDLLEELYEFYISRVDSKAQASMRAWESKLTERDKFIASKAYDENTFEMLDKMMGTTPKLWADYERLSKLVQVEDSQEAEGKGGSIASASDSGEI